MGGSAGCEFNGLTLTNNQDCASHKLHWVHAMADRSDRGYRMRAVTLLCVTANSSL